MLQRQYEIFGDMDTPSPYGYYYFKKLDGQLQQKRKFPGMRLFYPSQTQSNTTYKHKKYIGHRARLQEIPSFLKIFYGDAVGRRLAGYFFGLFF